MISRLVLNLRTFDPSNEAYSKSRASLPAPEFAQNRILGNIGAPLDADQWDEELFHDEEDADVDNSDHNSDSGRNLNGVGAHPTDTMVPVVRLFDIMRIPFISSL